jgi:hypothetical protein
MHSMLINCAQQEQLVWASQPLEALASPQSGLHQQRSA